MQMQKFISRHIHIEHHHWCPVSQEYTGGDTLYSFLNAGWMFLESEIYCEKVWLGGTREVIIYHVQLYRQQRSITMKIIHNPYVEKLLGRVAELQSPDEEAAPVC